MSYSCAGCKENPGRHDLSMEAYSRAESEGEFSDWKGKWVAVTGTIIHGPFDAATSAYREGSKHSPDVYVSRIE